MQQMCGEHLSDGGRGSEGAECRRNEKMTSVYRKKKKRKDGSVRGFSMRPESACSVFTTNNGNPADAVLGGYRPVLAEASAEANI